MTSGRIRIRYFDLFYYLLFSKIKMKKKEGLSLFFHPTSSSILVSKTYFKEKKNLNQVLYLNSRNLTRDITGDLSFIARNPNANYRLAASVHGALNQLEPRWHRKEPLRPGY